MKNILPETAKRVSNHTCNKTNTNIKNSTINSLKTYKNCNSRVISDKINKLNNEWDTERCIETRAASVILLSSIWGFKKNKCPWFLLTGTVGLFLLQHALQGWCPSLPFTRKMGIRTAEEINNEKTALKWIRGDFNVKTNNVTQMLDIVEND